MQLQDLLHSIKMNYELVRNETKSLLALLYQHFSVLTYNFFYNIVNK